MKQPDFRALCAELVEAFEDENTYTQRIELISRARTALATPPPEPPTDEELDEIECQCWIATEVTNDAECDYSGDHHRFARAVLKRWGR